jgi:hypothetical protein
VRRHSLTAANHLTVTLRSQYIDAEREIWSRRIGFHSRKP